MHFTFSFVVMRIWSPYWCSTSVCWITVLKKVVCIFSAYCIHVDCLLNSREWSAHVFLLLRWNSAEMIFLFEEQRTGNRREGHYPQQPVHSACGMSWVPKVLVLSFFFLSIFVYMYISVYSWVHLASNWHQVLSSTLSTLCFQTQSLSQPGDHLFS